MKKLFAVAAMAATLSVGAMAPGSATGVPGSGTLARSAHQAPRSGFSMTDRFARRVTTYGDADTSAYHIDHVFELQYRLKWDGILRRGVTGYFGKVTYHAVKRFQRREGLRVSGVATHATWSKLIQDTIRHRRAIPHTCKTRGWHACYDRAMHQVTLWHNGGLYNSWLVRGGDYEFQTRIGTNPVYYRDIDHVSTIYGTAMPYSQFFSGGEALHGSPFMTDPFVDHSHGCVNMYIHDARQLWQLTSKKRLLVTVYGAWS